MTSRGPTLPFDADPDAAASGGSPLDARLDARDRDGREFAVNPRHNVALEASAGTGKTRVLVTRYVNLLREGVEPSNILAITFTRKAAAEMRERILATLREAAERGEIPPARWRALRDRLGEIAISTIDAFCLSLLREFPLEADLDPGFQMADDTEVPRLIDESLDRALRICRGVAREDEQVALVFAQLRDRGVRGGLASLLYRRLVAPGTIARFLSRAPRDLTAADASRRAARALLAVFEGMEGGLDRFLATGPLEPAFLLLRRRLERLADAGPATVQAAFAHAREYFLTQEGQPRARMHYPKARFRSAADWETHRDLVVGHARGVLGAHLAYRRDLNVLVSRGVSRMFQIALAEYRRTLEAHAVLDFPDVLLRALDLLRQMEEFSQSRYRLESRYHHVLVDEFQDTSRAQWELISLLVEAWGEGAGLAYAGPVPPSIFIVGDRKQSIYGFRDAQASILREASAHLATLRPGGDVRRTISRSFRAVPELLAFVNDVCRQVEKTARVDAFQYAEEDHFPEDGDGAAPPVASSGAVQFIAGPSPEACAEAVAAEIARLVDEQVLIRDRRSRLARPVRPGDIAILFRTRDSHREFEHALGSAGLPSYVYKGLGFFDADEIRDVLALLWYLADPVSDLRTAALLRSRFVRISDDGLSRLAGGGGLADALRRAETPAAAAHLDPDDAAAFEAARQTFARWRGLVDRVPPAELLDRVLTESAYAAETRGPRALQARENLKKIRSLVRRIQNRGYATLGRLAAHLDRLAVGDESNAVIDALDAVSLMTVHAAKGLEFPVVFVVNLARGTGNRRASIRVATRAADDTASVAVGDFLSDTDDDEAAREREETKRLLYVALTRARDRLYLATVLDKGRVAPGRGSLADVLPPGVLERLASARGPAASRPMAKHRPAVLKPVQADDLAPLVDSSLPRAAAAVPPVGAPVEPAEPRSRGTDSDRLVGTLVHRLLHRLPPTSDVDDERLRSTLAAVRPDELVDPAEWADVADEVLRAYLALIARPDLRALYGSGTAFHEVPFTMRDGARLVRGTIDCLIVRAPEGEAPSVTVLEFKTGRPRPEHHSQADLYTRAVRAAYPMGTITAQLFYSEPTG